MVSSLGFPYNNQYQTAQPYSQFPYQPPANLNASMPTQAYSPTGISQIANPAHYNNSLFNQSRSQIGYQTTIPQQLQSQYGYSYTVNPFNASQGYTPTGIDQLANPVYYNTLSNPTSTYNKMFNFGTTLQQDSGLQRLFSLGDGLVSTITGNTGTTTNTTNTTNGIPNDVLASTLSTLGYTNNNTSNTSTLSNPYSLAYNSASNTVSSGSGVYDGSTGILNFPGRNDDLTMVAENPIAASSMYGTSWDWALQSRQGDNRLQNIFGGMSSMFSSQAPATISPGGISWDRSIQGDIQLNNILNGLNGIFGS